MNGKLVWEQGDANVSAAESWIKDVWPTLIDQYSPDDIFNADETGINYRVLPETTNRSLNTTTSQLKTGRF